MSEMMDQLFKRFRLCVAAGMIFGGHAMASDVYQPITKELTPLLAARSVEKEYLSPLDLPAKSMHEAMNIMIGEGFLCGIKPEHQVINAHYFPPVMECEKNPAGFDNCPDLIVSLDGKWGEKSQSERVLFGKIDSVAVTAFSTFCRVSDSSPKEYVVHKQDAEKELAEQTVGFGMEEKTVEAAFQILIGKGFKCGFQAEEENKTDWSNGAPEIVCKRKPSAIRYCHEAKLSIKVDQKNLGKKKNEIIANIGRKKISKVTSSCSLFFPSSETF